MYNLSNYTPDEIKYLYETLKPTDKYLKRKFNVSLEEIVKVLKKISPEKFI